MELLAVDSEERVEKVKQVWDRLEANNRDILNYLKDLDNNLEANEDAYSDLSDPFSDMGDSEFAKAANQKRTTKLESDLHLMSTLRPELIRVQNEMLSKLDGGMTSKIYEEELGTKDYSFLVDMPREPDEGIKSMLDSMLRSPPTREEDEQTAPKGAMSPDHQMGGGRLPQIDFNERNSLSEVWRMLDAQSTSNGFPVSPIRYNVFDDNRMTWLKREAGDWREREASRKKCEDWLKKL